MPPINPMLTKRIRIESGAATRDAGGAEGPTTWTPVYTNLRALDDQKRKSGAQDDFDRTDIVQEVEWILDTVPVLTAGTKYRIGSPSATPVSYYVVISWHDFSNDYVTAEPCFVIKTHLRKG